MVDEDGTQGNMSFGTYHRLKAQDAPTEGRSAIADFKEHLSHRIWEIGQLTSSREYGKV